MQEHADRLSAHLRDELAFDRLFGDQAHGPAGGAGRRIRTHHRDDPLLLRRGQHFRRARTRALVERSVERRRRGSAARCCGSPAARTARSPRRWGHSRPGPRRAGPGRGGPRAPAGRRRGARLRAPTRRTASDETTEEVWACPEHRARLGDPIDCLPTLQPVEVLVTVAPQVLDVIVIESYHIQVVGTDPHEPAAYSEVELKYPASGSAGEKVIERGIGFCRRA